MSDIISTNVPPLNREPIPDFLRQDNWFQQDVTPYRLDFSAPYVPKQYTLSHKGIGFAPLRNLQVVTGVAGNGKTWLETLLMITLLNGDFGELHCELEGTPKVVFIDTEQDQSDIVALKHRIMRACGRNPEQEWERFKIYQLRENETPQERWRNLLKIIDNEKPNVAFLDGALDIIQNFNDVEEAQRLAGKLLAVTTHHDISLWLVLHQNPDAIKMTGHLGSAILRKSSDVWQCVKKPDGNGAHFEVSQSKTRGRDVESFKFRIEPVGFGRVELINAPIVGAIDDITTMCEWLQQAMEIGLLSTPAYLLDIREALKLYGGIASKDRQQRDVQALINRRILVPQQRADREKGQKHPKYNIILD